MLARSLLLASLGAALLAGACGGPASAENAMRAQKEYELAVGLMGEQNIAAAFEHLFKSIELDARNPESRLLLGNLYLLREEFDKAEPELRKARELAVNNESYGAPFVAEVDNSLGVVLVHQKRYDEAISVLRESATSIVNRNPHLAWGKAWRASRYCCFS